MKFGEERPVEDRLFEAALSLPPDQRDDFIREGAAGDQAVREAVLELMQAWREEGGDDADVTIGNSPSARHAWAAPLGEKPGDIIDHFRLVRRIGQGGMGSVWEAEQTAPVQRTVALKVIKLGMDTVEVVARFERERQSLAQMDHPHIAKVFEAGATSLGRPYFAMELVRGVPITTDCERRRLGLEQRLRLFLDVCDAVEHAHQKGIIHRDLKPSNLLVCDGQVKVIDFGVAKATLPHGDALLTHNSQVLGTPAYMSPEQAAGDTHDIDTRCDVYSLGVVLYETLTAQLPFDAHRFENTGLAEIQRILSEEEPPKPSTRLRHAPDSPGHLDAPSRLHGDLDWIVMKALAKERQRRYPSAAALAADLRNYLGGDVVAAVPPTLLYRSQKFVRKNRIAVGALAVVFLALAAALTVSLLQVRRANQARHATTMTVADLYTRNGLNAAHPTHAALWFAKAAATATGDPQRVATNLHRAAAWRRQSTTPVRVFDTGFKYAEHLSWNPRHPAILTSQTDPADPRAAVWEIPRDARWPPGEPPAWRTASWSPDGGHLAAADASRLHLLSYPDASQLAELPLANLAVAPAWSPDGLRLAVAGPTGHFVWAWRTGTRTPLPPGTPGSPTTVSFSRDGHSLLVYGEGTLAVCDAAHPHPLLWAATTNHRITPRFLGQGGTVVTADTAGALVVRDASTGAELERYPQSLDTDAFLHFTSSPDGRYLALSHGVWIDRHPGPASAASSFAGGFDGHSFSPDNLQLTTGTADGEIHRWALPGGERLDTFNNGNYTVIDCAHSPDARWLAASEQGLVRVWPMESPQTSHALPFPHTSLARLSPDGSTIVPSGHSHLDHQVPSTRLFDTATASPLGPPIDVGGSLMDVAFSTDASRLALAVSTTPNRPQAPFVKQSGGGSGFIQWVDPSTGEKLGPPIPLPSEPRGVAIHPTRPILGVCCAAGEGLEIHLETGHVDLLFDHDDISHPHEFAVNGRCAYSPDGEVFAVWALYKYLHLWHRPSRSPLIEPFVQGHIPAVVFHADTVANTWIHYRSELQFRDLHTGQSVAPPIPYSSAPWTGTFNPAGDRFLAAGADAGAHVWDWRQGKLVGPTFPHAALVTSATFLPGPHPWCATGDYGGGLHLWDYQSGSPVQPPLSSDGPAVLELQLDPEAKFLVVARATPAGIRIHDLQHLLATPDLPVGATLLLAEIDAAAEIHPNGGIVPLTTDAWLEKWNAFRARFPAFPGHRFQPAR